MWIIWTIVLLLELISIGLQTSVYINITDTCTGTGANAVGINVTESLVTDAEAAAWYRLAAFISCILYWTLRRWQKSQKSGEFEVFPILWAFIGTCFKAAWLVFIFFFYQYGVLVVHSNYWSLKDVTGAKIVCTTDSTKTDKFLDNTLNLEMQQWCLNLLVISVVIAHSKVLMKVMNDLLSPLFCGCCEDRRDYRSMDRGKRRPPFNTPPKTKLRGYF